MWRLGDRAAVPAAAKLLCNPRTFRELLAPGYAVVDFAVYDYGFGGLWTDRHIPLLQTVCLGVSPMCDAWAYCRRAVNYCWPRELDSGLRSNL